MKATATKRASAKNPLPRKDPKEVLIAKLSTKQAIIVAIVGLVSAVSVTVIANLDKWAGGKDSPAEEIGYYEGRASAVEQSLKESEDELQARSEAARRQGRSLKRTY